MSDAPYTRSEIQEADMEAPERGPICLQCGARIPQFAELSEADAARVRQIISLDRPVLAMQELRSITGCPLEWAKIWVYHGGHPDLSDTASASRCAKRRD